ncbi:MAG TPA: LUD domain-containing protein [Ktedonobacterales bacterium]|nr:LUD domain-containing protein [Ktedonobacterales bacterium]
MATFETMGAFTPPASAEQLATTVRALEANGLLTLVVETAEQARIAALALIPDGVEVFQAASRTLEVTGLAEAITSATRFQPMRPRLAALDRATQAREIRTLAARPDVIVGSAQAITERGEVLLASATGSQLGPAASGASLVIWVVGAQKLVRTLDEGLRRIEEYCLPLENERTQQAYGRASASNKLLIVRGEATPGRIRVILVKQPLGF